MTAPQDLRVMTDAHHERMTAAINYLTPTQADLDFANARIATLEAAGLDMADRLGAAHGEIVNLQAALAECKGTTPAPTPTPTPTPTGYAVSVGVFRGAQTRAEVDAHSTWQDRNNEWAVAFHGRTDGPEKVGWVLANHAGGKYRLNLRLGLGGGWGTLEQVAAGTHDAKYRACAQALVAAGRGDTVVSLGWESNMNGYPWKAQGREVVYVMAFRRAVNAMRSVAPGLKFSYCLLIGATQSDWRLAYPGDAYVDWIGLDAYDNSPVSASTPAARWGHLWTRPVGINEVFGFADERGKRKACFEWGMLAGGNNAALGGGDNPFYIDAMFDMAAARDVVLAYFEDDDGNTGALHELTGATKFPKSRDRFLARVKDRA